MVTTEERIPQHVVPDDAFDIFQHFTPQARLALQESAWHRNYDRDNPLRMMRTAWPTTTQSKDGQTVSQVLSMCPLGVALDVDGKMWKFVVGNPRDYEIRAKGTPDGYDAAAMILGLTFGVGGDNPRASDLINGGYYMNAKKALEQGRITQEEYEIVTKEFSNPEDATTFVITTPQENELAHLHRRIMRQADAFIHEWDNGYIHPDELRAALSRLDNGRATE